MLTSAENAVKLSTNVLFPTSAWRNEWQTIPLSWSSNAKAAIDSHFKTVISALQQSKHKVLGWLKYAIALGANTAVSIWVHVSI